MAVVWTLVVAWAAINLVVLCACICAARGDRAVLAATPSRRRRPRRGDGSVSPSRRTQPG